MSSWHDAERQMTHEVVGEFAEPVAMVYWPMTREGVNSRRQLDTSREKFSFKAMFDWQHDKGGLYKSMSNLSVNYSDASTRQPWVFAHRKDLKYESKQFDVLEITWEGQQLFFEIADVQKDGKSGIIYDLTQIGLAV
jgi:hypothetical protein